MSGEKKVHAYKSKIFNGKKQAEKLKSREMTLTLVIVELLSQLKTSKVSKSSRVSRSSKVSRFIIILRTSISLIGVKVPSSSLNDQHMEMI